MTSADVAARAGVSRSTVSLVLNGKGPGRVSPAVIGRITAIAEELGYHPNAMANSLRLGRSKTVAYVAFAPGNDPARRPRSADLFGAEQVARACGYTLVVHRGHSDAPWASIAAALTSSRIDGAIFPSLPGMMAQLEHFSGRLVMRGPRFGPVPAADLDHVGGAETAVRYLRELGHQRIGYLWPGLDGGRRRHNTWRRLMEQDGLASTLNSLWVTCGYSVEQARLAALSLLRRQNRPTALLCDDEIMAAGVYKAARLLELSVPHDLSVLAFMDDGAEQLLEPELTTIDMPYQQLGALTMELMVEILAGRTVPDEQLVPTRLVVRGSTGPAPAAGDARLVPAGAR